MEFSRLLKPGRAIAAPLVAFGLVHSEPGQAQATSDAAPTFAELQRQLKERDAVIADLLRRVQELETRVGVSGKASPTPAAPPPPPPPKPPRPEGAAVAQGGTQRGTEGDTEGRSAQGGTPPAAPGAFPVDEEAVERALERTLVEQGALLLPPGAFEVEPSLTYTQDESSAPVVRGNFIAEEERRQNVLEAEAMLRFGLPYDAQAEVDIPYEFTRDETVTSIRFADVDKTSSESSGFGDVSIGLTKTLLREKGWRPDLLANVTWDTRTGGGGGGAGSGFDEVTGTLTAVKRIDPIVWVGNIFYQYAFEHNDVRPGDEIGFSLGPILAISPETSARLLVHQTFSNEVEAFGEDIPGSDQVEGTVEFGVSSVLSRRVLLDLSAEIGVTEDAPDFEFGVSLPIRFDLPILW